jgi:hypothetical protein
VRSPREARRRPRVLVVTGLAESNPSFNPIAAELESEFPLLWKMAQEFDLAERLGGCTDPLRAEVDAALRELWLARQDAA